MKLYYTPGACSLSPHIVLEESGLPFELEKVDLQLKETESGHDFYLVNTKGSVPALELDDGQILTEGAVIVQYLADQVPEKGTEVLQQFQEMLHQLHAMLCRFCFKGRIIHGRTVISLIRNGTKDHEGNLI